MRRPLGILMIGAAIAAGCSSAPPAGPTPGASASSEPSTPVGALAGCEPIDLRTTSGERVDLTGTWLGPTGTHHVRQHNSCVWWVAISEVAETPEGNRERLVFLFRGELASDFTLTGELMLIMGQMGPTAAIHDTVTFNVEISPDGETMTLLPTNPGGPFVAGTTVEYVGPLDPDEGF